MTSPLCTLDLARMRRQRVDKLRSAMHTAGIDTLLLCSQPNVSYATGARVPASDHVRAAWWRAVAIVTRDDPWPHLFTEFPEGATPEMPNDHLHPAIEVEAPHGAAELVSKLPGGRLAIDDASFSLWRALGDREVLDANAALGGNQTFTLINHTNPGDTGTGLAATGQVSYYLDAASGHYFLAGNTSGSINPEFRIDLGTTLHTMVAGTDIVL